jgi:hypothetical protein
MTSIASLPQTAAVIHSDAQALQVAAELAEYFKRDSALRDQ